MLTDALEGVYRHAKEDRKVGEMADIKWREISEDGVKEDKHQDREQADEDEEVTEHGEHSECFHAPYEGG